jgi:copper(I)-binding protein
VISRRTLGAALVAVLPLAAACGQGRDSTTDRERQTPYVASAGIGSLLVTAATLVPSTSPSASAAPTASDSPSDTASPSASATGSASPTPSASASAEATPGPAQAYLAVTIANRGTQPDTLSGVVVPGATVTPTETSAGSLTVPPQQLLRFGNPELGETGSALAVNGSQQPWSAGTTVRVTFQFDNAGAVTLAVPVRSAETYGTTATSTPLPLTGGYPTPPEEAGTTEP